MKTLYEGIYEGILKGMDDTLEIDNAWSEIYPAPKIRDFYKSSWGSMVVVNWKCPDLIQQYIADIQSDDFRYLRRSDIIGIEIHVSTNSKLIDTYLYTEDYELIELKGVGDWVSDKLPVAKQKCIEFLQNLVKNPDNIQKIIKYNNKCIADMNRIGFCDKKTFDEILK